MKILIVHNQLWAHYKAIIFNELQKIIEQHQKDELLVVQIATIEKSRVDLGNLDTSIHQYPYKLLHDGTLEEVSLGQKVSGILREIRQFKPDVVNLTGYYDLASWAILFYCKLKGIKTILSNESTAGDHVRDKFKESIKSFIIKQYDGYFNFGTLSKNYLIELGAKTSKMLVNRNCVDNVALKRIYDKNVEDKYSKQQLLGVASHNFIFVGRLIDYKNLINFLKAFAEAQKQITTDWGVIILGDGEQKEELQRLVSTKQIKNISFQKGVSWQQVPEYLALSDVLVLPSYSEPWGLVVNEAMACGMPVLVSEKCGCAIDLVKNGVNGFTFSPYNQEEITTNLLKFMSQSQNLKEMGIASQQIIQEYSPENVAKEMYAGYLAVL
ncbi:glycosyltransferase involved in cell wall biosynthesis [Arcicella aurantiaca]|uniref:Glycosyltransferase involved in cell wall biosynthesis n=1 Tax=Arcicella aurantiaca TaxID=591202 RepID=A0A316EAB6_9BACT|nr:glycosyltransferase family 4 protein [Arcicella aurantiaca]PWK26512.1 glycosyltransferase involved in cell wall biosynthesis [Arcicella aurantiaca]